MTFFKDSVNSCIVMLFILAIITIIVYFLFFDALYQLRIQISEGLHRNLLSRISTKTESSENCNETTSSNRNQFISKSTTTANKNDPIRSQVRNIVKKDKRKVGLKHCDLEKTSKQTSISSSASACANKIVKSTSSPNTTADCNISGDQPQLGTSRSLSPLETELHTGTLNQKVGSSDILPPLISERTNNEHFEAELIKEVRRISGRIKSFRPDADIIHNLTQQLQLYKNSEELNTSASLQNLPQQDLESQILPDRCKDNVNGESSGITDSKLARLKKLKQKVVGNSHLRQRLDPPSHSNSLAASDEQINNESQKGEICQSTEELENIVSNKEADKSKSVCQTAPFMLNGKGETVTDTERQAEDKAKLTFISTERKNSGKKKTFKEVGNAFNFSESGCNQTSNFTLSEELLDREETNQTITTHSLENKKLEKLTLLRTRVVEFAGKVTTCNSSLQNPSQIDNELPVSSEGKENRRKGEMPKKVACKLSSRLKKQKNINSHLNQPSTPSLNSDLLIKKNERITCELQNKEITQTSEAIESAVSNEVDKIELAYAVIPLVSNKKMETIAKDTKKKTKFNAKSAASTTQPQSSDIKRKRKREFGESLKSPKSNFDQTSNFTQMAKKLDIAVGNIVTEGSLNRVMLDDSLSVERPADEVKEEKRSPSPVWEMVTNKKKKTNVARAQQICKNRTGRKYLGEMSHKMKLDSFCVTAATTVLEANSSDMQRKLDTEVDDYVAIDRSTNHGKHGDSLSVEDSKSSLGQSNEADEEKGSLSPEWEIVIKKKRKRKIIGRSPQICENRTEAKDIEKTSHKINRDPCTVSAATNREILEPTSSNMQRTLDIEVGNNTVDSFSNHRKVEDSLHTKDHRASLGPANEVHEEKRPFSPEGEVVIKKKNLQKERKKCGIIIGKKDIGGNSYKMDLDSFVVTAATTENVLELSSSNTRKKSDTEVNNTTIDGCSNHEKLEDSLSIEDPKSYLEPADEVNEEKMQLSPEWELVTKKKKKRKDIKRAPQTFKNRIEKKYEKTSYKLDGNPCTISAVTEELTTAEKDSVSIKINNSSPEAKNKPPSFSTFSNSGRLYSDVLKLNSETESFCDLRTQNLSAIKLSAQKHDINPFIDDQVNSVRSIQEVGSETDEAWRSNIGGEQYLLPLTAHPLTREQKQECQAVTRSLNQVERAEKVSDWMTWKDESASYSAERILSSGVEKIDEKATKSWDMWKTGGISVSELVGEQQKKKPNALENVGKKSLNQSKETERVARNPTEILSTSVKRQRRELTETNESTISPVINLDVEVNEVIHSSLKRMPYPEESASQQRESVDTVENISDLHLSEGQLPESVGISTNEWTPNWREKWIDTWKKAESTVENLGMQQADGNVFESVHDAKSKRVW